MALQSGLSSTDAAMLVAAGKRFAVFERTGFVVLVTMLLGASGLLALRRAAGALVAPLSPAAMLLTAIALVALAAAVRSVGRPDGRKRSRAKGARWTLRMLGTLSVLVAAVSLSLPGSGWLALTALWGVVLAGEVLAWRTFPLPSLSDLARVLRLVRRVRLDPPQRPAPHLPLSGPPAADGFPGAEVFQQLTRCQRADGAEEFAGWLRVVFHAGQRTENVHVAFCPPFAAAPQLTVAQLDGPAARMKTAQLLPYGVRLDLKLSEPAAEDTCIVLEFNARMEPRSGL